MQTKLLNHNRSFQQRDFRQFRVFQRTTVALSVFIPVMVVSSLRLQSESASFFQILMWCLLRGRLVYKDTGEIFFF
jgi:hypothetical protein